MNQVLLGAIGMASLLAGGLFARFWRRTHDRLFLFFAASFWLEGINRFLMGMLPNPSGDEQFFYLVRLGSFLLIVFAIVEKNWAHRRG